MNASSWRDNGVICNGVRITSFLFGSLHTGNILNLGKGFHYGLQAALCSSEMPRHKQATIIILASSAEVVRGDRADAGALPWSIRLSWEASHCSQGSAGSVHASNQCSESPLLLQIVPPSIVSCNIYNVLLRCQSLILTGLNVHHVG